MYNESLIKASLASVLKERSFDEAMTDDAAAVASGLRVTAVADRATSMEALLKERIPQDLFTLNLGNHTLVDIVSEVPSISHIFREMWEAEQAINDRAAALGWAGNATSAFTVSQADGYVRHFQNASVYWTRGFGAKEVHGAIRDRYFQMGAELSYLGFPQTDELRVMSNGEEVRYSNFQGGSILWTANRGAFLIPSFSPITERFQTGAYLHMTGTGFTPNGRVTLWIVNAPNAPQSIGTVYAAADGRFGANRDTRPVYWLHNRAGDHAPSIARAVDEASGQVADYQLSYALY